MPNVAHDCVDRPHLQCPACLAAYAQAVLHAFTKAMAEYVEDTTELPHPFEVEEMYREIRENEPFPPEVKHA
jgi:hypothetical protein